MERIAPYVAAFVVAASFVANLRFVRMSGERVAFAQRMTIDAASYVRNARRMIVAGELLFTPDTYHSVGASVYVAAVLRVLGSVLAVKIVNAALLALALVVVHRVATRTFASGVAACVATCALASSILLARYCAIVQYEILALFLFVCALALASHDTPRPFWVGIVGALAASLRVHFGGFVLLYALELWTARRGDRVAARRAALHALAGFALVALPFNAYYAARTGAPFFFQSAASGGRWLARLNENAVGVMWPYPPHAEPHGLTFVAEEPGLYLRLLGRKLLFLFGVVPDVWHLDARITRAWVALTDTRAQPLRIVYGALYGVTAALGLARVLVHFRQVQPAQRLAAMQVVAVLAPQLVVGSSTRILVPIVPSLILLQLTLARDVLGWRRRQKSVYTKGATGVDESASSAAKSSTVTMIGVSQ